MTGSRFPLLAAALMTAPLFSPLAHCAGRPGDTGTLTFPIARAEGASPLSNVRLEVSGAPPWLQVLPGSPTGPVTIGPNDEFTFRVDYQIGPSAASNPSGVFNVTIRHDSPVLPASKTWRIETPDALAGFLATCTTSDGADCGTRLAPDRTPPASRVVYTGPVFVSTLTSTYLSTATIVPTVFISTRTTVRLEAEDPVTPYGETSGVAYIGTAFDRIILSKFQLLPSSGSYTFKQDPYALFFAAVDNAGNYEEFHVVDLRADGTPPTTAISIGAPRFTLPDGSLLVSARTAFLLNAVEVSSPVVASGVRDTQLSVNGSSFAVVPGTFSLSGPDGPEDLRWFSEDNVLNAEAVQSTAVVLDATPPAVSLACPSPASPPFCRVFKGIVPVRGSATDLHFASWRLDVAPGADAVSGFVPVAAGTSPVNGAFASWDASALSGFFTLRLSAVDAVDNASSLSVDVFVGDPARLYAVGGHEIFEKPSGVAVDASSRVYVADAGKDRVLVYGPDGAFVRAYGTEGRREPSFKEPSGVALDGAGNIWVADTGRDRLVKLSPAGDVLAMVGRREVKRGLARFKPGKEPGEFRHPGAVAVDAAGRVYAADTGNRRIEVFDPGGTFLRAFAMPPIPGQAQEDDERDDDGPSRGVPVGVAVDNASRVYAADRAGARVVVFDAGGAMLRVVGAGRPAEGAPLAPGQFIQPWGVAVSSDGRCLAVADREAGRIQRFDEEGRVLLAFGVKADDDDGLASGLAFRKLLGLALGPDGALYAADAGSRRVEGFSWPDRTPVVNLGGTGRRGGFRTESVPAAAALADARGPAGAKGAALRRADGAGVDVPEGALDEELALGVYAPDEGAPRAPRRRAAAATQRLAGAGPAVEFGPHGLVFDKKVALTLPYDNSLATRSGWKAADLVVHFFDETSGAWTPLATRLDESRGLARAETDHFSVYQVLGPTLPAPAGIAAAPAVPAAVAADPAFVFRDLYAFPNPARGSSRQTIRVQVGLADSVDVNVYDVSGEKVFAGSFGAPSVLDDGNGKGPQWTYDLVWDAGSAASGVYVYVVTAKKAGQGEIRRPGRLAVIR